MPQMAAGAPRTCEVVTNAKFTVWIIAPLTGTGTHASRMRLLQMFKEEFAADFRPADVRVVGADSPLGGGELTRICGRDSVDGALEQIAEHNGPRLIWIVANTRVRRRDRYVDLDGATDDPLSVGALWEDIEAAASKQPNQPLIAVVDACHAAPPAHLAKRDNFAWICSSALDEKARSTEAGAWMTLQLVDRFTKLPGAVQLQDLTTHLANVRDSDGPGQRPRHEQGDLATQVLNRVPALVPNAPGSKTIVPAPEPEAALAAWRRHMLAAGEYLRPLFGAVRAIDEVYVDVNVGNGDENGVLLADLLSERAAFVIEGHAGAGKTTLARRLTRRLAKETGEGARVPVYLSLAAFALSDCKNLVDYAGEVLKHSNADAHLADALPAALRDPSVQSRLCFLLDGLDEVRGDQLAPLILQVEALVGEFAGATIAVFTRPMGDDSTLGGYRPVRVLALSRTSQQRLLTEWLKDKPGASAKLWETIEASSRLQELAGNPMLLTMLALVAGEGRGAPKSRAELYRRAIDVLLTRGHQRQTNLGVPAPQSARVVLRHLSLALQIRGGETWTLDELVRVLEGLLKGEVQAEATVVETEDPDQARAEASAEYDRFADDYISGARRGLADADLLALAVRLLTDLRDMPDGKWALELLERSIADQNQSQSALARALKQVRSESRPAKASAAVNESVPRLHAPDLLSCPQHLTRAAGADDAADFLRSAARHGGVLYTPGGDAGLWTYLHRSLRDSLAAEQLGRAMSSERAAVLAFARTLKHGHALGRWGETFALLAAQVTRTADRRALLAELATASPNLCRRVLLEIEEHLPAQDVLDLLARCRGWDGEDLLRLARRWQQSPGRVEALRAWAAPATPPMADGAAETERAARVHYALTAVGAFEGTGTEDAFFVHIDRRRPTPGDLKLDWSDTLQGSFSMGTLVGGDDVERPVHEVTVSPFQMGTLAVTKEKFARFEPEHDCRGGDRHPVTNVSWYLARLYARWAGADLPSEAQWEYACRAGTQTLWSFGDDESDLAEHAWYKANSERATHPVKGRAPNPGGLYDMHGNVWEWCGDWFGPYSAGPVTDPPGPDGGVVRVLRGGSCWKVADGCRSAFRNRYLPEVRNGFVGFRLCRRPQLEV